MNNLHSIVYTSTAERDLSKQDLEQLLMRSTERNRAEGITGILLFCEGKFIQYLEGPYEPLLNVYSSICSDSRHHDVIQLLNEPIAERFFSGWSMGYSNIHMINFSQLLVTPWAVLREANSNPAGATGVRLLHKVWEGLTKAGY